MSNIIQLNINKIPITLKHKKGYCRHPHVLACEKTRMLVCEKCGAIIDPFDFMWEWGCGDRNLEHIRKRLMEEVIQLDAELKELKRQERNVKARIKRMNKQ